MVRQTIGYKVEPTAPDSSHQNGPGERPHQTIVGDALRSMLAGSGLEPRFWPYGFHHFLRLYNVTPHGTRQASPYEICTGQRPNLKLLRTFGCRVWVMPARPNGRRPEKITPDARKGIFLGYSRTMKNILYYDLASELVKTAQHVVFDEAMNDLPADAKPLNARLLFGLPSGAANCCGHILPDSESEPSSQSEYLGEVFVSSFACTPVTGFSAYGKLALSAKIFAPSKGTKPSIYPESLRLSPNTYTLVGVIA